VPRLLDNDDEESVTVGGIIDKEIPRNRKYLYQYDFVHHISYKTRPGLEIGNPRLELNHSNSKDHKEWATFRTRDYTTRRSTSTGVPLPGARDVCEAHDVAGMSLFYSQGPLDITLKEVY
jgi:hypothetical protein